MGYMKIQNLYKVEHELLRHDRLYVMEKIHGTSAHVTVDSRLTQYHGGGCKHDRFVAVAERPGMLEAVEPYLGEYHRMTFFGEAFGGNIQKMRHVYGDTIQFAVFDVLLHYDSISGTNLTRPGSYKWLDVPDAQEMAARAGYTFVPYVYLDLPNLTHAETLAVLDNYRDRHSDMGSRLGYPGQWGEGIVIKPSDPSAIFKNGTRAIAKHKTAAFLERERQPARQADIAVENDARRVAEDWVNAMRLTHVIDKLNGPLGLKDTPVVCAAVLKDVMSESADEIIWSKAVERAIKVRAAELFKQTCAIEHPQGLERSVKC